jgi:hypothetical protein
MNSKILRIVIIFGLGLIVFSGSLIYTTGLDLRYVTWNQIEYIFVFTIMLLISVFAINFFNSVTGRFKTRYVFIFCSRFLLGVIFLFLLIVFSERYHNILIGIKTLDNFFWTMYPIFYLLYLIWDCMNYKETEKGW